MTLVKTNLDVFPAFGNLLNDFFDPDAAAARMNNLRGYSSLPKVNIKEDDSSFVVEVAAPGMSKSDFTIKLDHNVLTISAEKKEDKKEEDGKFTRREFAYRTFERSFTMPETADGDNINARYENGVLYLSIPKKKEENVQSPRMINIS
ncbi:MAG: Hsp20/alpha crystallin family protein [Chryseosolibacter sp.]